MSGVTIIYVATVIFTVTLTAFTPRLGLRIRKTVGRLNPGFDYSFALAMGGMLTGTLATIHALVMHITENGL